MAFWFNPIGHWDERGKNLWVPKSVQSMYNLWMYFETTHVKRYYIVLPKSFTRGRRWMGWTMVVVVVLVVEVGVWFTSPSVCLSVCLYFRKIRSFRLFYCSFPVSLPQWQITFSCLWHQSTGLMGSNLITCPFDCLSSIFPCFTWPLLKIGSNESIVWSRP